MQQTPATFDPTQEVSRKRRTSRLSIASSIVGLLMGLACWVGLAALCRYATNEASAMLGWWMMFFGGSFAVLLGLIFSVVAYIPRGRAWPLATLSMLVNLAFPAFFAASAFSLEQGLWAVGCVVVLVCAVVGIALFFRRVGDRRGWSRRMQALGLILGLCIVGILALAMFALFVL